MDLIIILGSRKENYNKNEVEKDDHIEKGTIHRQMTILCNSCVS